jgi:histidine phosphotransferase ChpT
MPDKNEVVSFASLLASRLCHDLVNPVGALNTGLEVLEEDGDPEMRAHAMRLIKESTAKTVALLDFSRTAFGATGSWSGEIDAADGGALARALFAHVKAELVWQVPPGPMPKPLLRILLNFVLIAERCVPRAGSVVTAEMADGLPRVTAKGMRAKLGEDVTEALSGQLGEMEAKAAPAYLIHLIAKTEGLRAEAHAADEETIVFRILG